MCLLSFKRLETTDGIIFFNITLDLQGAIDEFIDCAEVEVINNLITSTHEML